MPSVVALLGDPAFINQMAHLGTLNEVGATETRQSAGRARELLRVIDGALGR